MLLLEGLTFVAGGGSALRCLMPEPDLSLEFDPSSFEVGLGLGFAAALALRLTSLIPAADEFSIKREYKIGVDLLRVIGVFAG